MVFDLNGTLTDPAPIGEALGASEAGDVVHERAVRSAFVDALTDVYRPLAEHIRAAVTVEARGRGLDRSFPAQVLWGEADPALRIEPHGEQVRETLGVDSVVRLPAKHLVQEDAPEALAERVAGLAASVGAGD